MSKQKKTNSQNQKHPGHIITVLLQDYFHRGVFKEVIGEKQWMRFGSRLDKDVKDTLDLFREYEIKATFFTLGWIADNYPEIIKKIVSEGHEIASAGYLARSVHEMTREQFTEDIERAKNALEGAGSNRILGYRCAYKWMRKSDLWVLDILADDGYVYDASLQPPLYSFTRKHNQPFKHEIETINGKIWEFPASTNSLFGLNFAIAGGNYLRQFPHSLMMYSFKNWCKATANPFILYFHPWELNTELPLISAVSTISRIRQYRNLGKMRLVLPDYFKEGHFQSINQYLNIPLIYPTTQNASPIDKIGVPGMYVKKEPETKHKHPKKEVSVVIPCFNEVSSLPYLEKAIDEMILESDGLYNLKFIFVDDCSQDRTYDILQKKEMTREDFKVIGHSKNKGVAAAIRTGIFAADTEIVASIDADCSYDPLELIKMIPLIHGGVDMVTASPYHPDGFVIGVPRWRLFLSKSLSKIYHLFLRNKFSTYTSCLRVYRRSSIVKMTNKYGDFRGIVELLARLDLNRGIIKEYPTTLQCRIFGHSKMKIISTIYGHLKLIFEILKYRINLKKIHTTFKIIKRKTLVDNSSFKKVWIDLDNSPHVPFFNPIINELNKKGYEVILTVRDCFQTCGLANLFGLNYRRIGRHYGKNKVMKVIGTLIRALQLLPNALRERPALTVSHGSRSQLITAWMLRIPSVIIFDYEYTQGLGFIVPGWVMAPGVIPDSNIVHNKGFALRYPGIKEDVYVPSFKPDPTILNKLAIKKDVIVVTIRPPATEAHYHNPESETLFFEVVELLGHNPDVQIVILPRNEIKQTTWIKNTWSGWCDTKKIIIPDHVVNGLDLIWYSDFVVSGGGTMNREAAALGVPVYSIFRGKIGAVDRYLSDEGRLTLLENAEDIRTKIKIARRDKSHEQAKANQGALNVIVNHITNILENP